MSDKLKDFVNKNKKEFDAAEPSKDLWKKIDSKMEMNSENAKSKWISNLKYFGFGASILLIAVYFISQKLNDSSSVALDQTIKDSALNNSGVWVKANQNSSVGEQAENSNSDNSNTKITGIVSGNKPEQEIPVLNQRAGEKSNKDTVINTAEVNPENKIKNEDVALVKEEKAVVSASASKRKKVNIPEAPSEINMYSGTLYDEFSLCSVVQVYKFTGKVNMDDEGNFQGHRTLKTMPCSKLENARAVWIKGKTSKKMTLTLTEGFKNIVLQKSDGRKLSPVAISHYYTGLGVISGYSGRHFDMIFKDKVELLLFFKDVEAGDKVIIDESIEAVVK
jgi:hypothetical protein